MSIRFGIAGLVLVWFTKPPWGYMREIFVVALIGSTIQYGLTYNGLKGIDASTAAILVQLEGPILALMGTILLKEKLGLTRALGMGFAFLGVFIIAGEPRLDGHIDSVILLVAGSTVWAVAQIMISRLNSANNDQPTKRSIWHYNSSMGCNYGYPSNAYSIINYRGWSVASNYYSKPC